MILLFAPLNLRNFMLAPLKLKFWCYYFVFLFLLNLISNSALGYQEREYILRSTLQLTEDWLYDDGDDETEHAYVSKL